MTKIRTNIKRNLSAFTILFISVFVFSFFKTAIFKDSNATSGFDPENIISNEVMGNYDSMTEAEIQAFLDSKNNCGALSFTGGQTEGEFYVKTIGVKTYKWHIDQNQKHICLAQEKFGNNGVIGSGDTAAHLIYTLAQEYKINPQVILVLLQKEQALLTDPYPNNFDYGWALGFGAYDFGDWDTKYAGFKEQLIAAFKFYHWFIYDYNEADSWWDTTYTEASPTYIKLGESNIAYNKNPACGYSTLNLKNSATVSLYVYTPYQPNASVPKDSSGTGDSCGSYGNRNFYIYFTNYFGDIQNITNQAKDEAAPTVDKTSLLEDIPINEQTKMILYNTDKIELSTGKKTTHIPNSIKRRITQKYTEGEKVYYITEYDQKNENSKYGILAESVFSFENIEEYYTIPANTAKINIEKMQSAQTIPNACTRKFTKKIAWKGKTYYQTEYDDNFDTVYVIELSLLSKEYAFVNFENPRKMVTKTNTYKIDPYTKEQIESIENQKEIYFVTKIKIDEVWYYRTAYDTERKNNYAILASDLDEI